MATNTSWGYEGWSTYSWGGQGQDVTVYVGVIENTWGNSAFGYGTWNGYVPDPNLQLNTQTPCICRCCWISSKC
jgi:hypothetical protein